MNARIVMRRRNLQDRMHIILHLLCNCLFNSFCLHLSILIIWPFGNVFYMTMINVRKGYYITIL